MERTDPVDTRLETASATAPSRSDENTAHSDPTPLPTILDATTNPVAPLTAGCDQGDKQYLIGSHSEPRPVVTSVDHTQRTVSNSVPSLRFPRPLGNRQLTNWVSSSSPDIMQPGNIYEEDASLAELGYDVIGTDGESQAESTTSSLDYQRPDDIHSLVGTDTGTDVDTNEVDSESSDEEHDFELDTDTSSIRGLQQTATGAHSLNKQAEHDDIETLADRSLESPTRFSQHLIPSSRFPVSKQRLSEDAKFEVIRDQSRPLDTSELMPQEVRSESSIQDSSKYREPITTSHYSAEKHSHDVDPTGSTFLELFDQAIHNYGRATRHGALLVLAGILLVATQYMFNSATLQTELSTVPLASVSPDVLSISTTPTAYTPTTNSYALQTSSYHDALPKQTADEHAYLLNLSVERSGHNGILIKTSQKSNVLIAVSRDLSDIPTDVSTVEDGFLLQIPTSEARGILNVTIATKSKKKSRVTFPVDFRNALALNEAFDTGKKLLHDLTQRLVDTMSDSATLVEEATSFSNSAFQGINSVAAALVDSPGDLVSKIVHQAQGSFKQDDLAKRVNQVQLEVTRQLQDASDELALGLLTAQLSSKLWWLRVQGKTEEHQHYLLNAEAYFKEKLAHVANTQRERAARTKKQIRAQWEPACDETSKSFWSKGPGGA